MFEEKITVKAAIVCGMVVWALCAIGMTAQRLAYNRLRTAYEAALGAFVCAKVPLANAAELASLKEAIAVSQPSVKFMKDQTAYRKDGSTYTVEGMAPVTDFGIVRRPDGTWFSESTREIKNKK